jgi:tetratricopeptide (TPR) repeat protein
VNKTKTAKWYFNKYTITVYLIVTLLAGAYLVKTWPYNFAGAIVYRLLGKPDPRQNADLVHIKKFLSAKRKLDKKDYQNAQILLEELRTSISGNFLFFREIYLYLGYVYDVKGEFDKEMSLYIDLDKKDKILSRFLTGLYYYKHGQTEKTVRLFNEALLLDNKSHKLGDKYRAVIEKLLKEIPQKKP